MTNQRLLRQSLFTMVCMGVCAGILLIPLAERVFAAEVPGTALPVAELNGALKQYTQAMQIMHHTPGRVSLSAHFQRAMALMEQLRPQIEAYAHAHWDEENYDPTAAFQPQLDQLEGVYVAAYEGDAVIMVPNYDYWAELAREKGQPEDVAFFKLAAQQYPEQAFVPVFIEMTWDYGGCDRYGEGVITDLYSGWRAFQQAYPQSVYAQWATEYTEKVKAKLNVQEMLSGEEPQNVCSCEGKDGFVKELERFVQMNPADELTPAVNTLLETLKRTTSPAPITFECHYG